MKILLVHDRSVPGGLETRLLVHARALAARGHQVFAAAAPGLMSDAFESAGVVPVSVPLAQARSQLAQVVESLRATMRDYAIDFCDVHPHWSLLPGGLAALAAGVPFSLNFHGLHDDDEQLQLERSLRVLAPYAAFCTANSLPTWQHMERRYGVGGRPVVLVPNVVDCGRFGDAPPASRPPKTLLLLSRLDVDKRCSLEAAVRMVRAYAQLKSDAVLRVGGAGSEREWLAEQLARIPIAVEWAGPTAQPEREIARADAVLGLGRVALEGLAARRPVAVCGVLGNLAGLCTVSTVDHLFDSNFNGRNAADQPPEEVARQLMEGTAEESEALRQWLERRAGPQVLEPWLEAIERERSDLNPAAGAQVATIALDLLASIYRVIGERDEAMARAALAQSRAEQAMAEAESVKAEQRAVKSAGQDAIQEWASAVFRIRAAIGLERQRPIDRLRSWRALPEHWRGLKGAMVTLDRQLDRKK